MISFFSFVFTWIFKYRKGIILKNFDLADIPESKLNLASYYKILAKYIVETFASFTMSQNKMSTFVNYKGGIEAINSSIKNDKNVFILASHFGNWEIIGCLLPFYIDCDIVAVYRPLSNKTMDYYVKNKRSRFGVKLVSMTNIIRYIKTKKKPQVFILISDQSPPKIRGGEWVKFLNRDTYFYNSIKKISKFIPSDIYFQSVKINQKGYEVDYRKLENDNLLIESYARDLGENIKEDPMSWLWSHNRWKLN